MANKKSTSKKSTAKKSNAVDKFQKAHPTKASKEKALRSMTNAQIDTLIKASSNIQAKNFYASFKK